MKATSLSLAVIVSALAVTACGDSARQQPTPAATHETAAPPAGGEEILIKSRLRLPTGKVLAGSRIGDSAFCPGGSLHDEHGDGSESVGLVVRTYQCPEGRLTITFSPTQRSFDQSSDWHIVRGTGHYAGLHGFGHMVAHFRKPGIGRDTFSGRAR